MIDIIRSEWIKFRSLPSMAWTMLTVIVLTVGLGALFSLGRARAMLSATPADRAAWDPTAASLSGLIVAQVAVTVLGVLVITSEFATGMIRPSLTVAPHRARVLIAKATMLTVVAFVVGTVAGLVAYVAGQPIIAHQGVPHSALGDPGVLRAVFGSGLYLAAAALFGLALGALVRATAGALAISITIMLLAPIFSPLLPAAIASWMSRWWPSVAGLRVITVTPVRHAYGPWSGIGVLAGFALAILAAALINFRRRDV